VTAARPIRNPKTATFNAKALANTSRLALIDDLSSRVMNPEESESSCRERKWERSESEDNCLNLEEEIDFGFIVGKGM
jgi:hypothetical protein